MSQSVALELHMAGGSVAVDDGRFEQTAGNWQATAATWDRSSAQAYRGSWSGLLTVTGSPASAYVRPKTTHAAPVLAGQAYTVASWCRSVGSSRTVTMTIEWLDAAKAPLSSSSDAGTGIPSNAWRLLEHTATAPVGAAYALYGPTLAGAPPTGAQLHVDDVDLINAGVAWTPVPLYSPAGTTITRGQEPYGSWPRAAKIECEINNDGLAYDPTLPESPLYGRAGLNTKAKIRVGGLTRTWAEASSWAPDRTGEHVPGAARGRSWTKITAEGMLRRFGIWTEPLRSPMYRTNSARTTSIGHWPLEDAEGAVVLANSVTGGRTGTVKGATLGDDQAPLGAESTVKIIDGAQLAGVFLSASTTAGWQFAWSLWMPATPPSATYVEILRWTTSTGYTWLFRINNAGYRLTVTDSDGTTLSDTIAVYGALVPQPNAWMTHRVKAFQSGADVQVEPARYQQGDTTEVGYTTTFTGSVGALRQWWSNGTAGSADTRLSHVFGVTTVADSLVGSAAQKVFNGYLGETAVARFARLCLELGVTRYWTGSTADGVPMGPQRPDTFLNLLRDIVQTEDGRIDDERADLALTMRHRRDMLRQTPALTLTFPTDFTGRPRKIIDDQGIANRVTAKNRAGGEQTRALTAGPKSTAAPPDGASEYKQTVDVSVQDPDVQLGDLADWHLAKGTVDRPRYDEVVVDLLANPGLAAAAVLVDLGDMIQIDDLEPDPVPLLVCGIVEKIGATERLIVFQTEPYEPYQAGKWDDPASRWDARTSTCAEDMTAIESIWDIQCTDRHDVWSTTSLPYDWKVAGERVTVTAMTAAAGSGPYTQTATVTRAVNGVSKSIPTGTPIHLADPVRWAL